MEEKLLLKEDLEGETNFAKTWATPLASLLTQLKVQDWKELPISKALYKTLQKLMLLM